MRVASVLHLLGMCALSRLTIACLFMPQLAIYANALLPLAPNLAAAQCNFTDLAALCLALSQADICHSPLQVQGPCRPLPCSTAASAVQLCLHLLPAGEQIGLQAGCLTVLSRAQQAGVPTHVVSVNYSSEMVKAALQRGSLTTIIS